MDMCRVLGASELDESGGFELPDVNALDAAASSLKSHAQSFRGDIDGAAGTWQGLESSYVSDESSTVMAAFGKVTPLAARVDSDASSVADALAGFSSTCRELRRRLEAYGSQVRALDADINNYPTRVETTVMVHGEQVTRLERRSWRGDEGLTSRRQVLADEIKAIHEEYLRAQDNCERSLALVSGAGTRGAERIKHADMRSGNFVTEFFYDAGTFLGIEHGDQENLWGPQTLPFRANGVVGELQGFAAGGVELGDGVWTMVPGGANAEKNRMAVEGFKALAAGRVDLGALIADSFHADDFATEGHWAAGTQIFNVASMIVPGGALVKAGSATSRLGSGAAKLGSAAARLGGTPGAAASALGAASRVLTSVGGFLSRPGALGTKISALVMPRTTGKILDALGNVKAAAWEHTVVRTLEGSSTLLKHFDGVGTPGRISSAADGLESLANKVRVDHVIPDSAPRYPPNVFVDKTGNPVRVRLDDGTIHEVATRRDQISKLKTSLDPSTWDAPDEFLAKHLSAAELEDLATRRGADGAVSGDLLELKVAEILHRNLDPQDLHGIQLEAGKKPLEQALAPLAKRFYYDLTDEQAVLVHDLRHMMGTGDSGTVYQKVMTVERGERYLDGTEEYLKSVGGFISKAADTAELKSVDEIILGLRLDYAVDGPPNSKYKVISHKLDEFEEMIAIRFQTEESVKMVVPDDSNVGRVNEVDGVQFDGDDDLTPESTQEAGSDKAIWPNTGHGFTSSRVGKVPIVPELQVSGGVAIKPGAEMWRVNKEGKEVLVGIFSGEEWKAI